MPYVLAIDVHPTRTTVAVQWDGEPPALLSLDGAGLSIPTMLGISTNDQIVTGTAAGMLRSVHPSRVVDDFVLRLGDPRPMTIAERPYAVSELMSLFLGAVYRSATAQLRSPPTHLAIVYPSILDGYRLHLLAAAATQAGLPQPQLIADTAAVSAYAVVGGPSDTPTAPVFGALHLLASRAPSAGASPHAGSLLAAPAQSPWPDAPPAAPKESPAEIRSAQPVLRGRRPLVVLAAVFVLIAAIIVAVARSDSADNFAKAPGTGQSTAGTRPGTGPAPPPSSATGTSASEPSSGPAVPSGSAATGPSPTPTPVAMTETIELDPRATWQDGTRISAADFDCTRRANLRTPGATAPAGYDKIIEVKRGKDAHEVVITFTERFAAYRTLFGALIEKRAVRNCDDISGDFQSALATSAGAWKLDSWSETQEILVPNDKFWGTKPTLKRLVLTPEPDDPTGAVARGDIDYTYQLFSDGIAFEPAPPKVAVALGSSTQFEALYFNEKAGRPFADPAVRRALYESIDLNSFFDQIYAPIAPGGTLLTCGPVPRGPFCPTGLFGSRFDLDKAAATMTAAGYARGADGFWAKDGVALDIKWMVNSDNVRRESAQALLIPQLAKAGFNVTADNCDAACVFQDRLPALDYDLTMYINTGRQDPLYLVPNFTSDNIPIDANSGLGLNDQAWDNATATAALHASETELDPVKRAEDIHTALIEMDRDSVLIPLYQFPSQATYRTDRVSGVDRQVSNTDRPFSDVAAWKDVDGDGQIVIGLPSWPACLNPVTACGGSYAYLWSIADLVLPGVFEATAEGGYAATSLVIAEPAITTP